MNGIILVIYNQILYMKKTDLHESRVGSELPLGVCKFLSRNVSNAFLVALSS